jgi:hypothetical protein
VTTTIAPLLGGLFLILAIGAALRLRGGVAGRDPARDADVLNNLIMDVTMPALVVHTLAKRGVVWSAGTGVVATTAAIVVAAALGALVARVLGGDRKTQGSALLVGSFCNTGFLGFPLLLTLFPDDERASSAALLVDTINTTLMLWIVGLPVAAVVAGKAGRAGHAIWRLLLRPLALSLVVGFALHAFGIALPAFLDGALETLGKATSPLVFLSLGLQLDVSSLKGRIGSVTAVAVIKLVAAPAVALVVVRALALPEPVASVAVLDMAMPSAMASVIVAAEADCDRAFAAAVATVTTLLCVASLPAVGYVMELWR